MKGVKLKVGTSGLFGPFTYYDEDGKTLIGYDVDLLNNLQDILGFEIDGGLQAMDYSALTTSLAEGKLDFGPWEQIFYGEFDGKRKKRMLFYRKVLNIRLLSGIMKSSNQTIPQLCNYMYGVRLDKLEFLCICI